MYKLRYEEIKVFAEKYADDLSGEGDYFEEIEKAYTQGAHKYLQLLEITEHQNEQLKERVSTSENELITCEALLNESLETIKWMFNHMKVDDSNLQSDAFNIPANTIQALETHLEIFK